MARYAPISQQFAIARQATDEATKKIHIQVARREHSKVMRTSPRPISFKVYVDTVEGAAVESVKAGGNITFTYPRLDVVAEYAMQVLYDLSPIGPPERGHYRDSHTLFLNGAAVANLKGYQSGDDIVISNPMPYARKIELGVMKMKVSGSARVYDMAERKVRARYGSLARIIFTYRGIAGGGVMSGRAGNKSDLRYPALVIRER